MFNEMLKTILGLFLATVIVVIILNFAIAGVAKPEIGQTEETAPATSAPTEHATEPTEPETTPETTAPTEPSTEPSPTETQATEPPTTPTAPRETEPPTEAATPETEPPAATVPPTEATEPETETEPVTEPTKAPTEETEPAEEWRSLGTYTLTAYCACQRCCGKAPGSPGYGITASGATAVAGVTIAVDPRVIPYGTEVKINDHIYIAQDTGGAINGSRIDVYFDNHQDAWNFGRQTAEVFIRA